MAAPIMLCDTAGMSNDRWLECRMHGPKGDIPYTVGGSDVAAIFGVSPWTTPLELWLVKKGRRKPSPKDNPDALEMGHLLEPIAAHWYAKKSGDHVYEDTGLYQHADHKYALANFDRRFTRASDGEPGILECKSCTYHKADSWADDAIPLYYELQFRYYTLNSWNGADSYACNMKIDRLGLSNDIVNKLFDLLDCQEFFDCRQELMECFNEAHHYRWQAGMNGRSGGYLVLYEGQLKPTGHLSYCTSCGQRNYKSVLESTKVCGKCGSNTRVDYTKPPMMAVTFPGRGVDMGEDFSQWSMADLRDRVVLVQELDRLADDMVSQAIFLANHYDVVEEAVYVPQSRKVMAAKC